MGRLRVFVTGASGFIGGELVRQLVAMGHEVVGLVRTPDKANRLRAAGAEPIVGDVGDEAVIRKGVTGADAVAQLALPRAGETEAEAAALVAKRGTQALLNVCRGISLKSFVHASGALGVYRHGSGEWIDETAPEEPSTFSTHERCMIDNVVRAAHRLWGLPAVILRPPFVYGVGSAFKEYFLDLMRRGVFRVVGDGSYYINLVHVEDCAAAYRLAIEQPPVGETLLVVDDEPVTLRTFADSLAQAMGKRRPGSVPAFLARLVAGRDAVQILQESVRLRNVKVKSRLGWSPQYPTYREGVPAVAQSYLAGAA